MNVRRRKKKNCCSKYGDVWSLESVRLLCVYFASDGFVYIIFFLHECVIFFFSLNQLASVHTEYWRVLNVEITSTANRTEGTLATSHNAGQTEKQQQQRQHLLTIMLFDEEEMKFI